MFKLKHKDFGKLFLFDKLSCHHIQYSHFYDISLNSPLPAILEYKIYFLLGLITLHVLANKYDFTLFSQHILVFVEPCKLGWQKDGTICRKFINREDSWENQLALCKSLGASLVTMKDAYQSSIMEKMIADNRR